MTYIKFNIVILFYKLKGKFITDVYCKAKLTDQFARDIAQDFINTFETVKRRRVHIILGRVRSKISKHSDKVMRYSGIEVEPDLEEDWMIPIESYKPSSKHIEFIKYLLNKSDVRLDDDAIIYEFDDEEEITQDSSVQKPVPNEPSNNLTSAENSYLQQLIQMNWITGDYKIINGCVILDKRIAWADGDDLRNKCRIHIDRELFNQTGRIINTDWRWPLISR